MPKDVWQNLREEILQNLDIRRVYEEFGVKFTGKISSSNWAECHAFGREDKTPSAGVNLTTAVYKDFTGDRCSVFDFMVMNHKSANWQDAQEELAKKCGLAKKIPKKAKAKRTEDLLGFTNTFTVPTVIPMARLYGISHETIQMTGARIARYPATSQEPQIVVAFPVFAPIHMLEEPPDSFVLQSGNGKPIMIYQGPDAPAKPEKRIVIGHTGILNRFALENWEGAERIYKVEGLSDMLVLQEFIPEEYRKKHLVITNACGTDDGAPAWDLATHLAGKEFVIIHDADVPGQFGNGKDKTGGAQRWVKAACTSARLVKNPQLPYEIASKHGKDLRNWIAEPGRKYSDLLELVNNTKDEVTGTRDDGTGATKELTETQRILQRLEITVLGRITGRTTTIIVFNQKSRRRFPVSDIDKFTYNKMLSELGDSVKVNVNPDPEESASLLSVKKVQRAIAYEASHRQISRNSAFGPGLWESSGHLILVGSGQWLQMNGILRTFNTPDIDDKLIDFCEPEETWYKEEGIRQWLPHAADVNWRIEFMKEFAGVFQLWDNWAENEEEKNVRAFLMANLTLASWVQDIWGWRPWIAITGESNSGKSTLFKFLQGYFGGLSMFETKSTEAAIRQKLGTSSKILLLDEFEGSKERDKTLDWLKGAGAGTTTSRGTPGQHSITMNVKVMPWFGATEAGMKNETERNRYVMMNMFSRLDKERFHLPDKQGIEELRHKSLAVILRVWSRAKELCDYIINNCSIKGIAARYTEGHAVPCAMWSAIVGHTEAEAAELFSYCMKYMLENILFTTEPEQQSLLTEIAHAKVDIGRGEKRTVSELLTSVVQHKDSTSGDSVDGVLARNGIRKMSASEFRKTPHVKEGNFYVFIAHNIVRRELLRGSPFFEKGIDQLLLRVICDDESAFNSTQRLNGTLVRGIVVPIMSIIPLVSQADDGFVPPEHQVKRTISSDVF